jgi:hypothetical protein
MHLREGREAPRRAARSGPAARRAAVAPDAARLLSLQRSAGNAAATLAVQRQGPPALEQQEQHFDNVFIQGQYETSKAKLTHLQVEALHKLDTPAKGAWAKLSWDDVAVSAAQRVIRPSLIDQELLGVCGEAAALEADAEQNAPEYADFVRHVYETGEVDGTKVNKELLASAPRSTMAAADWMALSALQDASNLIRDYSGQPTETDEHGKTKHWTQKGGLDPEGTTFRGERWILEHLNKCVDTETLSCSLWGEIGTSKKASEFVEKHGDGVVVIVENDGGMLQSGGWGKGDGTHNHWVRLTKPIVFTGEEDTDRAKFQIFTWGSTMDLDWPVKRFKKWVYGYLIGAKHGGILDSD